MRKTLSIGKKEPNLYKIVDYFKKLCLINTEIIELVELFPRNI